MLLVFLTGCTEDLFKTAEYRRYHAFSQNYKVGMSKRKVFNRLGCPDAYIDQDENYQKYDFKDTELFSEKVLSDSSVVWIYDCYELSDPANPYKLKVTFDSESKCKEVDFSLVRGG